MWTWAFLFPLASLAEFISSLIFTLHPCLSEFLLICWLHHLLTLYSRATNLMSVCLRNFISSFVRLILTKCFCSLLQNWVPQVEFFSFTRLRSHLWASRALSSSMLMSLWTVIANSTDVCFIVIHLLRRILCLPSSQPQICKKVQTKYLSMNTF